MISAKARTMGSEIEFEHGGTESAVEMEQEEVGEWGKRDRTRSVKLPWNNSGYRNHSVLSSISVPDIL